MGVHGEDMSSLKTSEPLSTRPISPRQSGARRLVAALGLACLALAPSLPLRAAPLPDIVRTFAQCTGRYSAQMEFSWLMGVEPTQVEQERDAMIALLEAVTPREIARKALHARIEAKQAQARLLTRSAFGTSPQDATWARARAELEISTCRALMLG